jgi:adenosylcobyric acid synthase
VPVLGVIPYFRGFTIDAEDAVPLAAKVDPSAEPEKGKIAVAAIYFPHISNFTDLSPLEHDSQVELHYLHYPRPLSRYKALILPGSKNVRGDLAWLCSLGWESEIRRFREQGGIIMGICGGFQMLGNSIADPYGVEGGAGTMQGLGYLDVETVLEKDKCLANAKGTIAGGSVHASGYEIHMGRTALLSDTTPFIKVSERNNTPEEDMDGAVSRDGKVLGTYFHGIFDEAPLKEWFLTLAEPSYRPMESDKGSNRDNYDRLAEHFLQHLDLDKVFAIIDYQRP